MPSRERRLLIVSPHFPPSSTADSQRVRMLLPFLRDQGWSPTVLAVDPQDVASPEDPWLAEGIPPDLEVVRVRALGLRWSRLPGLGNLDLRAILPLRRAGDSLLRRERFDLIYFSTTVFLTHLLGPHWLRRFGVPFVMDYQDPWVSDYYREHPQVSPPGGRVKYALSEWLARRGEPHVLRACAGITAVSPDYPEQIARRYPALRGLPALVLPFPGAERDFERAGQAHGGAPSPLPLSSDSVHWLYVGRAGPDMHTAVAALLNAVSDWKARDPGEAGRIRIHFIGTSYAPGGRGTPTVAPIAASLDLAEQVTEQTDRIPYSQTLKLLRAADALVIPGSDDPGYTASKIYPYLLAGKPLLAVFHENSSVVGLIQRVGGGVIVPFASGELAEHLSERIRRDWLDSGAYLKPIPLDREAFYPYTDAASAKQLCGFLRDVLRTAPVGSAAEAKPA